jgi:N-methylhydantoinase A
MIEKPALSPEPPEPGDAAAHGEKPGTARTGGSPIKLYQRELLRPDQHLTGPALVFQLDSTTYVAPGWSARVDGFCNLILEHG